MITKHTSNNSNSLKLNWYFFVISHCRLRWWMFHLKLKKICSLLFWHVIFYQHFTKVIDDVAQNSHLFSEFLFASVNISLLFLQHKYYNWCCSISPWGSFSVLSLLLSNFGSPIDILKYCYYIFCSFFLYLIVNFNIFLTTFIWWKFLFLFFSRSLSPCLLGMGSDFSIFLNLGLLVADPFDLFSSKLLRFPCFSICWVLLAYF